MRTEKQRELFDQMIKVYVKCVRHTLVIYLQEEWADKPQGWYGYFKELDAKNTAKSPNSKTEDITAHVSGIHEFDFQACNKTLQYISEVRDVIYKRADVPNKLRSCINPFFGELITIRNKYIGHENYTDEQLEREAEYRNKAVEMLHMILRHAFNKVVDPESPAGNTFFSSFEQLRLDYLNEHKIKAYYLSDCLDMRYYDSSSFFATCKKLGIDTDIVDDKYIFYTYNLEGTLNLLRNFLAKNGDGRPAPAPAAPTLSVQPAPTPEKNNKKLNKIIILCVCGLIGTVLIFSALSLSRFSELFDFMSSDHGTPTQSASGSSDVGQKDGESAPDSGKNNQIPEEYKSAVEAFKLATPQRISLMTLNVKVGELAATTEAQSWGAGTIYSEDSSIAVGEGILVKGVSPGETYITYVHNTHCIVYRVIVTE